MFGVTIKRGEESHRAAYWLQHRDNHVVTSPTPTFPCLTRENAVQMLQAYINVWGPDGAKVAHLHEFNVGAGGLPMVVPADNRRMLEGG